jgi:hypothetical protein
MDIIEKMFLPSSGELRYKEGIFSSKILDAEIDVLSCTFNNDECVEINTKNYTYITLSLDNLYNLIDLIKETKDICK